MLLLYLLLLCKSVIWVFWYGIAYLAVRLAHMIQQEELFVMTEKQMQPEASVKHG